MNQKSKRLRPIRALAIASAAVIAMSGCSGAGGTSNEKVELTLATVSNPQMKDMEQLKGEFENSHPNIKVNFVQMEEGDLRDSLTKDIATQAGQYDIVTIGQLEVPIWQKNGWLTDLSKFTDKDPDYDVDDIFPSIRDSISADKKLYAVPFYGESSFLMYNKEIFEKAGLTMPAKPKWTEVAELARKLKTADTAGICLRGKPGWGENLSSITTVVDTFGGAWFDKGWNAKVDQPEFKEAIQFYSDLLVDAGQSDPVSFGFSECLNIFNQGKAAMWYDSTAAAGILEDPKASPVTGKVGYAPAPVQKTASSGWLWSWNLAIPASSKKQDAAWEFMKWATGKDYASLVGEKLGWSRVPAGARISTYEIPEYQQAASAFASITKEQIFAVNASQPGVDPQPYAGSGIIPIPEWPDTGNQAARQIAEIYAGRDSVDNVLPRVQALVTKAGEAQK